MSVQSLNNPIGRGLGEGGKGRGSRAFTVSHNLGAAKLSAKDGKPVKIASGHLNSPVAFSRETRNLNRTRNRTDRQMGSGRMR